LKNIEDRRDNLRVLATEHAVVLNLFNSLKPVYLSL